VACSKKATVVSGIRLAANVNLKNGVFWDVTPFFIVTAVKTSNLVYNRIRDAVAPFLITVTIGLYGYEANNGMRGYVAIGESTPVGLQS
jgi:hypothetical protein